MKKQSPSKILMIMVDGFGVPPEGWRNSVFNGLCSEPFIRLLESGSAPIDARLGVEGLPQSATGQCALFTGVNAPAAMGRHLQGFPGRSLVEIIKERGVFKRLMDAGRSVCFANAYINHTLIGLLDSGMASVTTVMTSFSLGKALGMGDLLASKAVFHDITHRSVPAGLGAPLITPEKAACNLLSVSAAHDFTLFEYFLTDRAGHKRDMASLGVALRELSAFVAGIVRMLPDSHLFLLTSDHGNCEDMTVPTHTLNPVPLVFHSNAGLPIPGDISSLTGVSPYIEKFFS